jgi:hypothetical protein
VTRLAALLVVAFALASVASADEVRRPTRDQGRWARLDDGARLAAWQETLARSSLAARLEAITARFVGTTYGESPLGEGDGVDPDPRLRWDVVDCLTFVETALAMASAPGPDRLVEVLDDIRYAALPPAFGNRNHFVEAQWLPNNLLKGYLREITRDLGGAAVVEAPKEFSPERWKARRKLGAMPLSSSEVPRGRFSVPMIPFEALRANQAKVPAGTLLFVVRRDLYTQPTRVTHVGFVFDGPKGKVLRHASKTPFGRVVDEPLAAFLERNSRYERWSVEGFAAYEPVVPKLRVARLAGEPEQAAAKP